MNNVQAAYIAEEGLEAMTFMRDNGWTAKIAPLSTSSVYYLAFSNNTWVATTAIQYIDTTIVRTIELDEVKRDGTGEIVTTGGTADPDTRLVTVNVNYFQGHATTTRTMSTYLTNLNAD